MGCAWRDASLVISGRAAWGVMAAGIVFYEVACNDDQLLSIIVDGWLVSHPILTRAVIASVSLHLANGLPAPIDPLHLTFLGGRKLARMIRR